MTTIDIAYGDLVELQKRQVLKRYVVSARNGVAEFDSLVIATRHAQLNRPATIWKGEHVTAYCTQAVTHWQGVEPIARF